MSSLQNPMQAFDGLPIRQAVFRQIFPAVASQMITLIYNLADTYFVGLLNQPSQTAAITVVYSPFLMLTAISNLFGVGGASAWPGLWATRPRTRPGRLPPSPSGGGRRQLGVLCPVLGVCHPHPFPVRRHGGHPPHRPGYAKWRW